MEKYEVLGRLTPKIHATKKQFDVLKTGFWPKKNPDTGDRRHVELHGFYSQNQNNNLGVL